MEKIANTVRLEMLLVPLQIWNTNLAEGIQTDHSSKAFDIDVLEIMCNLSVAQHRSLHSRCPCPQIAAITVE